MFKFINRYLLIISFIGIIFFPACDNSIEPFDDTSGIFSIYGVLDINQDVNYIRVNDINTPIVEDSTHQLDAEVTLENLHTGQQEVLQDTLVKFEDSFVTNYKAEMDIEPATEYEINVDRSDGATTRSTITTPVETEASVNVSEPDCATPIELSISPVDDSFEIRPFVGFEYQNEMHWYVPMTNDLMISGDTLGITFTPQSALDGIFRPEFTGDRVYCHQLDTDEYHIRYQRFGPEWHDDSADSIAIEDGSGRFGGFIEETITLTLDTSDLSAGM